jgi:murein L,D-transpeptidase YafK
MQCPGHDLADPSSPPLARLVCACLVLLLASAAAAGAAAERWLLVDTATMTLSVMHGEQPQMTLHDIAIGRYGTSQHKRRGDNTTPLGRFRVTRIDRDAGFHRFIGLDYPDPDRAQQGYREGVISQRELQIIVGAHRRGDPPPQNTALGGQIGIHGIGRGDPALHEAMNWTRGCVALTNEQVDTLLSWIRIGMTVVIR